MLKLIFVGIWSIGMMTGSAYFFSSYMHSSTSSEEIEVDLDELTNINIDSMSIALIRNNGIIGYLMLSTVIIVDRDMSEYISIPVKYYARDVIISTVHKNENLDVYRLDKFDYTEFQNEVVTNINATIGKKMVHKMLIQNIDFITKDDVRDLQLRRSQ
ncbi:MAG: hypothetical protein GY742_16625 [Hyphomicrobiales bacterium]|nr:hypothetical protein [Hyphomicrobiales bacterium]